MKEEMKRFVLSDGNTINSKGFRIDMNGMDISRFETNPIMLYEHQPEKVIGRWLDVKKDNQKLTALPEFDTEDVEAIQIANKVERGFIKGASIGIIAHDMDIIEGVDVVTKSELFEASIVSIPADSGAIRLYNEKMECLSIDKLKLNMQTKNQNQKKMDYEAFYKKVCDVLGISSGTSMQDILETLAKLINSDKENEIEEAFNLGILTTSEHNLYSMMLRNERSRVLKLVKEKKENYHKEIDRALNEMQRAKADDIACTIRAEGWTIVKKMAHKGLPISTIKNFVDILPERIKLSQLVVNQHKEQQSKHDLDWYRKNNPKALHENNELYQSLLREYKEKNKH